MKSKIVILAALILAPSIALAAKGILPTHQQPDYRTARTIAGVDGTNEMRAILTDSAGRIIMVPSSAASLSVTNGAITVSDVGATDREQLIDLAATGCTLQAPLSNAGSVYVGGATVTNVSGANVGIELQPGEGYGSVTLSNANQLYVAADSAGDVVRYLCN